MALEVSSGILTWETLGWDPSEGSDWLWRDLYGAGACLFCCGCLGFFVVLFCFFGCAARLVGS